LHLTKNATHKVSDYHHHHLHQKRIGIERESQETDSPQIGGVGRFSSFWEEEIIIKPKMHIPKELVSFTMGVCGGEKTCKKKEEEEERKKSAMAGKLVV